LKFIKGEVEVLSCSSVGDKIRVKGGIWIQVLYLNPDFSWNTGVERRTLAIGIENKNSHNQQRDKEGL